MVIIRDACEKDVQGFIDCYLRVWRSFRGILPEQMIQDVIEEAGQPSFQENIRSAIANPDRILLVAEKDGEIVGHAQGRANEGGYSWLGFMGVSPDFRRRGIGRAGLPNGGRLEKQVPFRKNRALLRRAICFEENLLANDVTNRARFLPNEEARGNEG